MTNRYRKRKQLALECFGNKCALCGSTENLQFDHINPKDKKFTIAEIWSYSEKKFWEEIKKCQLLCRNCHNKKTLKELGFQVGKGNHGNTASYRYCHCELCKQAKREWSNKYYQTHKRVTINGKRVIIKWAASSIGS